MISDVKVSLPSPNVLISKHCKH